MVENPSKDSSKIENISSKFKLCLLVRTLWYCEKWNFFQNRFLDTVKLISNFLVNHKFASASSNICHTYWMAEVQWYARCHGFWQKSYASSPLRTCRYIATFRIHRRKFCYWLECTAMIKSRKILAHILQCHKTQGQHQRRRSRTNRFWQHHIS